MKWKFIIMKYQPSAYDSQFSQSTSLCVQNTSTLLRLIRKNNKNSTKPITLSRFNCFEKVTTLRIMTIESEDFNFIKKYRALIIISFMYSCMNKYAFKQHNVKNHIENNLTSEMKWKRKIKEKTINNRNTSCSGWKLCWTKWINWINELTE